MKIAIGNDHAGTQYKLAVSTYLESRGIEVTNYGTNTEESVDYPDFVHPVANDVESKAVDLGIIICGSGNGASMTANKHQGIRAALCWSVEIAKLAKQHNNANILSIPARFVSQQQAIDMVQAFLDTPFEGGRHQTRIEKIPV
ncbi:MAG TPA: ribose 5-phosphate isomerase B [Gillisia sp.]|nr:ribose 5-phosphate isomerase B [Gillisia sp.]